MTTPAGTPRHVADRYVDAVCDLDPIVATSLGTRPGDDRLPDPSPAGLGSGSRSSPGRVPSDVATIGSRSHTAST